MLISAAVVACRGQFRQRVTKPKVPLLALRKSSAGRLVGFNLFAHMYVCREDAFYLFDCSMRGQDPRQIVICLLFLGVLFLLLLFAVSTVLFVSLSLSLVRAPLAREQAYRSYLLAYSSHSLKNIYDVHELDLQAVARAFGFTVPPRVRGCDDDDDDE